MRCLGFSVAFFMVSFSKLQPDKASFWVMLGSLLLFIVWIVFLTYYMSRVIGPVIAFMLTRLAHLKGYDVDISMG